MALVWPLCQILFTMRHGMQGASPVDSDSPTEVKTTDLFHPDTFSPLIFQLCCHHWHSRTCTWFVSSNMAEFDGSQTNTKDVSRGVGDKKWTAKEERFTIWRQSVSTWNRNKTSPSHCCKKNLSELWNTWCKENKMKIKWSLFDNQR